MTSSIIDITDIIEDFRCILYLQSDSVSLDFIVQMNLKISIRLSYNLITIFLSIFSSTRILSEKNEVKRDDADASINESSSQNKV